MKFLTETQKYCEMIGVSAHQSTQKYPLNFKNVAFFIILHVATISAAAFILYDAKSFKDYTNSMYPTTSWIAVTLDTYIFIFRMDKIFEFIDHYENVIEKRE